MNSQKPSKLDSDDLRAKRRSHSSKLPFTVWALNVDRTISYLKRKEAGPLLGPNGKSELPLEKTEVKSESFIAVSWKHVGKSGLQEIEEPQIAREVLQRSLDFAKLYGAEYIWMDVYCITPAGIELSVALRWMGKLFSIATVYPDWAVDPQQDEARTSGWIFQERIWTRIAIRYSTYVEALANLIEYDYTLNSVSLFGEKNPEHIVHKDAEDLMDIMRAAARITWKTSCNETALNTWELLARTLVERGEYDILSAVIRYLPGRSTQEIRSILPVLARFIHRGRTEKAFAEGIIVFEAPQISSADVYKCISAISKTQLKYQRDASVAYFGVFNERCGTKYSPDNLPAPDQLVGHVVPTYRLQLNSTLAGKDVPMHVLRLAEEINLSAYTYTTIGAAVTEGYTEIGFCDSGKIKIVSLLEGSRSVLTAFGSSYYEAVSLLCPTLADTLRLPKGMQKMNIENKKFIAAILKFPNMFDILRPPLEEEIIRDIDSYIKQLSTRIVR